MDTETKKAIAQQVLNYQLSDLFMANDVGNFDELIHRAVVHVIIGTDSDELEEIKKLWETLVLEKLHNK